MLNINCLILQSHLPQYLLFCDIIDLIDIVIVLDKSTSMVDDFFSGKKLVEQLIMSVREDDYLSRIRFSLITFNDIARSELDLGTIVSRDKILSVLNGIQHTGGETSAASGFFLSLFLLVISLSRINIINI